MTSILFDLDGTLTDPRQGIVRSIGFALRKLGVAVPEAQALEQYIGPPLRDCFAELLQTPDEQQVTEAVQYYRERFADKGLFENSPYPRIESVLQTLRDGGNQLYVATSKPTEFATRIIDHFALSAYFERVYGSELDGSRSDKSTLLAHLLKQEKLEPASVRMVGDRRHDIIGARHNAVASIGVLWGFGSRQELRDAAADEFCETVSDLPALCGSAKLRPAVVADADALTACVAAAYRHYQVQLGKPPGPMLDDYAEVVQKHRVTVLQDGAQIVGLLVLKLGDQGILLDNIALHPSRQGEGLGKRLLRYAEEQAVRLGYSSIALYTHAAMTENIAFYGEQGYRETVRRRERGYDRVYFSKALD